MPNARFNTMISQHCSSFRTLFVDLSERLFKDEETAERNAILSNQASGHGSQKSTGILHRSEFGSHRELVAQTFLRPFTPDRFDLASGFILGADDGGLPDNWSEAAPKPAQCDILVIERDLAPFCRQRELGQFFPFEAISAIGEVKSQLSMSSFEKALEQVSRQTIEQVKPATTAHSIDVELNNDTNELLRKRGHPELARQYSPLIFLICRNFAVSDGSGTLSLWAKVRKKIQSAGEKIGDSTIPGVVLSVSDGLLIREHGSDLDRYKCISPGKDSTTHLKEFLSIYFSHLARWETQQISLDRYFQRREGDIEFDDAELRGEVNTQYFNEGR
jgi:hypothetical protein